MWRQHILSRFEHLPDNMTIENKYYGVYNTILQRECFVEEIFTIEPQYALPSAQAGSIVAINFVVTFAAEVGNRPVLFLEIKPPIHLQHIATRAVADNQMGSRFYELYNLRRTPRFYGISVIGKRIAVYTMDVNGSVVLGATPASPTHVIDTAPASRWDLDITSQEGYERFMAIVDDVKQMVQDL